MEYTGLYTAKRMSDGKPVIGYLLRYGRLFTFIVDKDYFNSICVNGKDEEIAELKMVRVLDGTVSPVPLDMEVV